MTPAQTSFSPIDRVWNNHMDPISQHEFFAECHSTEHLIGKERTQQISETVLWDTVFTHPLTSAGYRWELISTRTTHSHLEKSEVTQKGKFVLARTQRVGPVRVTPSPLCYLYTARDFAEEKGSWGSGLTGNYYHVNMKENQAIRNHVSFFKPSHLFPVKFLKEFNNIYILKYSLLLM